MQTQVSLHYHSIVSQARKKRPVKPGSFLQTLPEYEQWSQDLVKTWCQAKRVLKKGPKVISTQRSVSGDANYNKVLVTKLLLYH